MGLKNAKTGKSIEQDLAEQQRAFNDMFYKKVPEKVAQKMGELVSSSFEKEQYPDKSKWEGRKNESKKEKLTKRRLLVKTGDLLKSYQDTEIRSSIDGVEVIVGSDKVYAQIHNEGLQGSAFGKHSFKMPQRQVIPIPGEALPLQTQAEIDAYIDGLMDDILS